MQFEQQAELTVDDLTDQLKMPFIRSDEILTVEQYTDKSVAVFGNTRKWSGNLKQLGGKFTAKLRSGPGWIFYKSKEQEVNNFVSAANGGAIEPLPEIEEVDAYQSQSTGTDLILEQYTDKSIAVFGNTLTWAANLKILGGKFNGNLKGRPGWIFPKTKEESIGEFVNSANEGIIQPAAREFTAQKQIIGESDSTMRLEQYTDKSVAIFGKTYNWAENLKEMGGKFNANLKGRPGWIFSKAKEAMVSDFVDHANNGLLKPGQKMDASIASKLPENVFETQKSAFSPADALSKLTKSRPTRPNAIATLNIVETNFVSGDNPLDFLNTTPITVVTPEASAPTVPFTIPETPKNSGLPSIPSLEEMQYAMPNIGGIPFIKM